MPLESGEALRALIGPALCRILQANFREFPFYDVG
jgi:hypothetical protein